MTACSYIIWDDPQADPLPIRADVSAVIGSRTESTQQLGYLAARAARGDRSILGLLYYAPERVAQLVRFDPDGARTVLADFSRVWGVTEWGAN